jgi:myo-inositol-1(or 4)-monophosphatase
VSELRQYLKFAQALAHEAGTMMKAQYHQVKQVAQKADSTPVSEVDTAINQLVIDRVAAAFPTHGVLGEEASLHPERELLWVCDPIDGTIAYLTHVPTSTFMLAFVRDGQPQMSVVYNPWTDELFWAIRGEGAWANERRLHVSAQRPQPVIGGTGTTTSKAFVDSPKGLTWLRAHQWRTANVAGIGQKGAMVADGGIDGVFYAHNGAHDVAATSLLVTEAGGMVTDLQGQPQRYDRPVNGCILSNGHIHADMVQLAAHLQEK